jgi:hypothetical protein
MFHEETSFKHCDCGVIRRYVWAAKTTYQCAGCGKWADDLLDLLELPEENKGRKSPEKGRMTNDKLNFIPPGLS